MQLPDFSLFVQTLKKEEKLDNLSKVLKPFALENDIAPENISKSIMSAMDYSASSTLSLSLALLGEYHQWLSEELQ